VHVETCWFDGFYIQIYSPLLVEKSKNIKNQTNNKSNEKKST